jgi:hypothetical protein
MLQMAVARIGQSQTENSGGWLSSYRTQAYTPALWALTAQVYCDAG